MSDLFADYVEDDGDEDEFASLEETIEQSGAPTNYVTITTTTAGARNVTLGESDVINGAPGITLANLKARSAMLYDQSCQFFLAGTIITPDAVLNPGDNVMVVGAVKGG